MARKGVPDLDDMSRCPLAAACEACGSEADLDIATLETAAGVHCATFCRSCIDAGDFPSLSWPTATGRVIDHCGHLGIDCDQMAEAIEARR